MNAVGLNIIGRFGNQMFQYAYARAYAEQTGRVLHTGPWIGQQLFEISDLPLAPELPMLNGYFQDQASMIYTRADCRRWFTFRPEIMERLQGIPSPMHAAHLRHGDYEPLGYVVISEKAVRAAAVAHGFDPDDLIIIREETPLIIPDFGPELAWLPDFYRLMSAAVLFRGNSTFSWWAATLGSGRVFAPVIEGQRGGVMCDDVPFVEGNWPRFVELDFVTDLRLPE